MSPLPNPWLIAGAMALALVGLGAGELHGRSVANDQCAAAALQRDNDELTAAGIELAAALSDRDHRAAEAAANDARHQLELHDAELSAARVIADLRSGNVQLRYSLAEACPAGDLGPAAVAGDAQTAAVVSAADQERLLQIGGACDAQVKGLLRQAEADRRPR